MFDLISGAGSGSLGSGLMSWIVVSWENRDRLTVETSQLPLAGPMSLRVMTDPGGIAQRSDITVRVTSDAFWPASKSKSSPYTPASNSLKVATGLRDISSSSLIK